VSTFTGLVEQTERTREVYHITREENIPSIMKNGLEPRIGVHSVDIGEQRPGVHVFLNMATVEDAMMNWDAMSEWDSGDLSILTLEVPNYMVDFSHHIIGGTGVIKDHVPPSMIKSVAELY